MRSGKSPSCHDDRTQRNGPLAEPWFFVPPETPDLSGKIPRTVGAGKRSRFPSVLYQRKPSKWRSPASDVICLGNCLRFGVMSGLSFVWPCAQCASQVAVPLRVIGVRLLPKTQTRHGYVVLSQGRGGRGP